eukprot:98211-Prymnesium_polylepis.1
MAHLGLHCAQISLPLDDGETVDVRCPVRADMLAIWQRLPWWEQACEALPILREDAVEAEARRAQAAESEGGSLGTAV